MRWKTISQWPQARCLLPHRQRRFAPVAAPKAAGAPARRPKSFFHHPGDRTAAGTAGSTSLRLAGVKGHRRPNQDSVRRVQRHRLGDADQSRAVVTTFEYKPEAGVKYSQITNLTEDLCLGLQAESILIERIPGKPTVGIEVPNTRREVISLRQILESDEFRNSASPLTISLGKDISGRIKVTALDSMPHLLMSL